MKKYEDFKATEVSVPHRENDGNITMIDIPKWWKGSVDDVADTLKLVKKGRVEVLCKTPGGRDVTLIHYGKKNDLRRTANYSSALGAGDFKHYADKSREDYIPTVCLIGATHGGEFEGTVAINNLIKNIETGTDYKGEENPELIKALEGINLLIIPCLNMDGRARIPLKTFVGQSFESFRYFSQGTWRDGTLCMHPACKATHPLKDKCEFIGGYFNDNGVNVVHDNFFFPMAEETKAILKLADEYVPDITIHLHGGGNCKNQFYQFDYIPRGVKEKIRALSESVYAAGAKKGIDYIWYHREVEGHENDYKNFPPSFNIQCAWTALCGEPCIIYESNQGLFFEEGRMGWETSFTFDEIYAHHKLLFEETFKFVKEKMA